jgi:hypothetical protein
MRRERPGPPTSTSEAANAALRSFRRTGGATINLFAGSLDGRRLFAIAVEGRARRVPHRDLTASRIERYIEDQIDLLGSERYSLGIWYDAEEDVTWLDVSETLVDEDAALRLAAERGEKAIFALEDGREIHL